MVERPSFCFPPLFPAGEAVGQSYANMRRFDKNEKSDVSNGIFLTFFIYWSIYLFILFEPIDRVIDSVIV